MNTSVHAYHCSICKGGPLKKGFFFLQNSRPHGTTTCCWLKSWIYRQQWSSNIISGKYLSSWLQQPVLLTPNFLDLDFYSPLLILFKGFFGRNKVMKQMKILMYTCFCMFVFFFNPQVLSPRHWSTGSTTASRNGRGSQAKARRWLQPWTHDQPSKNLKPPFD